MYNWWSYDEYPETDPDSWETLHMKEILQIRRETSDYTLNRTENPSFYVQK